MCVPLLRRLAVASASIALPMLTEAQVAKVSIPGSNVAFDIDARTAKVDDHLGRKAGGTSRFFATRFARTAPSSWGSTSGTATT
jgi:hypothetical protein